MSGLRTKSAAGADGKQPFVGAGAVRQQLLTAASELLADRAPPQVTAREIAKRAGVNHGQIHHYFGSKDNLVAVTVADGAARYRQARLRDGEIFPLPIETVERPIEWRTLAYLAATDGWRRPPFEPSPAVAALARRRAIDLSLQPADHRVMADVAAAMAMQRGWWIFGDMIEHALQPFGPDLGAIRAEVAERSGRLIDETLPLAEIALTGSPTSTVYQPPPPADGPARGPDEVRRRLVEASARLLNDWSPEGVTTKQIAAEAGVNHGQVHHYFESKDHLVASAMRQVTSSILAGRGGSVPEPLDTERVRPMWRTLGYLAATGEWSREAYDRSPLVAALVERIAGATGQPTSAATIHAQAAAFHSLDLGWGLYRNIIEHGLAPLNGDLAAMRRRLASISMRLLDPPNTSSATPRRSPDNHIETPTPTRT